MSQFNIDSLQLRKKTVGESLINRQCFEPRNDFRNVLE